VSKYQTKQMFDGRRARVGDVVVLAAITNKGNWYSCPACCACQPCAEHNRMCLRAGIVGAISSSKDLPHLRDLKSGEADKDPKEWTFVATKTVEKIEALEIGQWTWPIDFVMRCEEVS